MQGYYQIFHVLLFPLILIASHSPHPSSPVLHLCLLYRLIARALGVDDEMGVENHGKRGGGVRQQQQQWWGVGEGHDDNDGDDTAVATDGEDDEANVRCRLQ
jgi:hypothetical protein